MDSSEYEGDFSGEEDSQDMSVDDDYFDTSADAFVQQRKVRAARFCTGVGARAVSRCVSVAGGEPMRANQALLPHSLPPHPPTEQVRGAQQARPQAAAGGGGGGRDVCAGHQQRGRGTHPAQVQVVRVLSSCS
jgi:hypothetical protein